MRVTILRVGQPLGNGEVISPAILGSLAMQEHPVPVVNPSPRWGNPDPPAIGWAHDFRVEGDVLTADVDGALPIGAEYTCSISFAVDPDTGTSLGARLVDVCPKSHLSTTRRGGETL